MSIKRSLSLIILITYVLAQSSKKLCGYNAHYKKCVSVYRLTCSNFSLSIDPWYEHDPCAEGCECDSAYIKDEITGQCVPPHYCPEIGYCPENSYFEFCKPCNGYQTTCSDYGLPDPMYCPKECKSGCYCDGTYVFDERVQRCVPVEQCSCKENEYFEPCKTVAWPACWPGCQCKPGYTYDYTLSRCVP